MKTERLELRSFVIEDADELYELAKDTDVGIHAGWPAHTSKEDSERILRDILMVDHQFAIIDSKTKKLMGAIGLATDRKRLNDDVKMMGYWIGKEFWNQGYMSEAAEALLTYAFQTLQCTYVTIYHYDYNVRSKRVIEKLGFAYEGYLHAARKRFDGEVLDELLYFMSKEMFEQR